MGKRKRKNGDDGIWTFGSPGDPNAIDTFNKNVNLSTTGGNVCGTCESFSDYDALDMLNEADDNVPTRSDIDDYNAEQRRDADNRLNYIQNKEDRFVADWFASNRDGNWGDCYPQMLRRIDKKKYYKFIKKPKFERCREAQDAFNRLVRDTKESSGVKEEIAPNFDQEVNKIWFKGEKYGPNAIERPGVQNVVDALGKGLQQYVKMARNGGRP